MATQPTAAAAPPEEKALTAAAPAVITSAAPNQRVPGRTRVLMRALESLARYVAADAFSVPLSEVTVELHDSESNLGVTLYTAIRDVDLDLCINRTDTTLFSFADRIAKSFADDFAELAGHNVGDVNIHFTHIVNTKRRPERKRRVR